MKFTGTVLAVLLANLLTIALIAGIYLFLKSDHGQNLLYELGLPPLLSTHLPSSHESAIERTSSGGFIQPRISDMKPMRVTPREASESQVADSPSRRTEISSPERKNHSAINSSLKMCRFWNAEYLKDRSPQSKAYRSSACKRYERLSGRNGSDVISLASAGSPKPTYQEQRKREEREREARQLREERQEHEQYCERVREHIVHYDSLLRTGGKAHYVNRLRSERKEVSQEYSRKCLLGQ